MKRKNKKATEKEGFFQTIRDLLKETANEDALPLIDFILNKANVSELKIAEKLKITVNQVRNILYRLGNENLVTFTRKKDKKKGWYIYYWTFSVKRAKELVNELKRRRLEFLSKKLELEESTTFFKCPNSCVRMTYEHAMDAQFKCTECGSLLKEEDTKNDLERVRREISLLKEELSKPKIEEITISVKAKPKKVKRKRIKKIKKRTKKIKRKIKRKPKKVKKKLKKSKGKKKKRR